MFCTHCGKKNPEQANFCFACGRPLTVTAPSDVSVNAMPGMGPNQVQASPGLEELHQEPDLRHLLAETQSEAPAAAALPQGRVTVAFTHPKTGEVKAVKVGWSWTCFLWSALFGIPLFLRGLTNWGLVMVALALLQWMAPQAISVLSWIMATILSVRLGSQANELTAKRYLQKGWMFTKPDHVGVRLARQKWGLPR